MTKEELKKRTKQFGLRIIRLTDSLPRTRSADVIGKQLVRCGTSVGANYRSSCRAKSTADFVAKMTIVEEEADEVGYWLELLVESQTIPEHLVAALQKEADEIVSIIVASIRTAKTRLKR